MQLTRKYLIGSVIFHMVVIVVATIIGLHQNSIKKTFVVFGAHSRKHTFVSYKPTKIVPFVSQPKRQLLAQNSHGNGKGRHVVKGSANRKTTKHTRNKKVSKKSHVRHTKSKHKAVKVKAHAVAKTKSRARVKAKPAPKPQKIVASKVPELEEAGDKIKISSKKQKAHKPSANAPKELRRDAASKPEGRRRATPKPKAKKPEPKPEPEQRSEPEAKAVEKPEPSADAPERDAASESEGRSRAEPVEPPKEVEAVTPVVQNEGQPDDISPEDEAVTTDNDGDDDSSTIDFNLIGDDNDQQRKVYQKHVQREVDRLWRPPVGVPKGTVCTVLFTVNVEGEVEEVAFLKRSSMLIYDLSIMRIAKSFKFAHCLWNKQFKIDFKQ
jgi:hypothetical protein